ncbi:invasion associated locus B family protein [Pseudooceanicola sp.]|uniref:invasion associated locus B family protein n=1 Tax=Pseudooceanicola sp. TaxID=1914328 RepID=UPI0040597B6F|tara:strand:- start:14437 stop:14976 length:540 start_codon:yes stop_codon:yes gene_type:complete
MISRKVLGLTAIAVIGAFGMNVSAASAQQVSENIVSEQQDWAVYEDADPKECWAVAAPKETVNTRDGRVVTVTRSQMLLMTFFRPGAGVEAQVTFTGGYPFASGSTVNLNVDGNEFELITQGEWAWPENKSTDQKIVAAMRAGASAIATGRSSRGTQTKDTFSLTGFTAAVTEAQNRCK